MSKTVDIRATSDNRGLGAIFSPVDVRDYRLAATATADKTEFPEEFVLPMVRVKDQGTVGSCVAHALSEVVEFFNKKQHNLNYVMSTDFIYGNRRTTSHTGSGLVIRDALKAVQKYGDIRHTKLPGNTEVPDVIDKFESNFDPLKDEAHKSRISTYVKLTTVSEIKSFLMNHGPVVIGMKWYRDYHVNSGGYLSSFYNKEDLCGRHCMVICGWNQYGWIIQNSWGSSWGTKGTCLFPEIKINHFEEIWGVTDEIFENMDEEKQEEEVIVKPLSGKIGQFFAAIFNFILNLFKKNK